MEPATSERRPMPEVEGVEHSYVSAGGLRMHVAEAGKGDPVVLLHGWPQHWYVWRGVIPRLAERYRVICPDLRGLGWSEAPSTGYDKETLGLDVLALLDELGLDRVKLVGHDWGGMAGFLMCLGSPERIERYVPINITHPWPQTSARQLPRLLGLWYQAVMASPVTGPLAVKPLASAAYRSLRDVPREEWDVYVAQFDDAARRRASQGIYRTFLLQELPAMSRGRYQGERLTMPTRFLHSEHDLVARDVVELIHDHADDFEIREIPRTGHFVVDEDPESVARELLDFFGA